MSESCSRLFKQVDDARDRLATSIIKIVVPFDELIGGHHIRRHDQIMIAETYAVNSISLALVWWFRQPMCGVTRDSPDLCSHVLSGTSVPTQGLLLFGRGSGRIASLPAGLRGRRPQVGG